MDFTTGFDRFTIHATTIAFTVPAIKTRIRVQYLMPETGMGNAEFVILALQGCHVHSNNQRSRAGRVARKNKHAAFAIIHHYPVKAFRIAICVNGGDKMCQMAG